MPALRLAQKANFLSLKPLTLRKWAVSTAAATRGRGWLCSFGTRTVSYAFPSDLSNVTVLDSTRGAVRVVKTLLELPPQKHVAWNTQLQPILESHGDPTKRVLSASAYAGDDVDFGNGPHLFVACDAPDASSSLWNLLRKYFEDEQCGKIWFDYRSSMRTLALCGVLPTGFQRDIESMMGLSGHRGKAFDVDSVADVVLAKRKRRKCLEVLDKNNIVTRDENKRPWEMKGREGITSEWITRACADASLTYSLDQKLLDLLKSSPAHGDASQVGGGSPILLSNESMFNLSHAYSRFFGPLVKEMYNIEREGVWVDPSDVERLESRDKRMREALEQRFLKWATKHSPDAAHMKLTSKPQLRQLIFAPCTNVHNKTATLPAKATFQIPKGNAKEVSQDGKSRSTTREVVLEGAGIAAVSHTKSGWPSVSAAALRKAAKSYETRPSGNCDADFPEAIESFLKAKELAKKQSHTGDATEISSKIEKDGRVRLQHRINRGSGRLENAATGKQLDDELRECHTAAEGSELMWVEYPFVEFQALHLLSSCDNLRWRLFNDSGDNLHALLARDLFGSSHSASREGGRREIPQKQFDVARMLDISMRMGGNADIVQKQTGCSRKEAHGLMERWYAMHPAVSAWRKERVDFMTRHGYAETYMGRRRNVKGYGTTRERRLAEGIAFVVDGTAAELVIGVVLRLCRNERLRALGWRVVLVDRQEIVVEGPSWSRDAAKPLFMEDVINPVGFEFVQHPGNSRTNTGRGRLIRAELSPEEDEEEAENAEDQD